MAIEITNKPDPKFPGEWQVIDDGLCYQRYDTETQAEQGAEGLRVMKAISLKAEELLDEARETLMAEFKLSSEDARRAMKEYTDFE